MTARRFYLNRKVDVSGNSGTGRVAEGCLFSNGKVALCWQTDRSSTTVYDSLDHCEELHSHGGATEIEWIDQETPVESKPMSWLKSKVA